MFEAKSFQFGTTGSSFGGALGFDFTSANATDSSQSLIGKMGTIGGSTGCGGLFGGDKKLISGTKIKFEPPSGQDSMVKNGQTKNITTRHQCITAMKHYEDKSIEELRYEDWIEAKSGGFGTSTDFSSTGGFFGSPNNKPEVPCGTNPTFGIRTASTSNDTKHSFGTNPTFGTNSTFGISRAPTFKPKVSFGTIPSGNKPSFGAFGFSTTDDKSRTSSPWGITANSGTFSFGKTSTSGFGAAPTTNGNNSSPPLFGNMETSGGNTAHGLFGPSLVSAFSNSVNEAKTPSITGFRFKTTKLTETDNSDTRKNVFSNGVVTREY
ncbi:nuclear pore complex protein Nup98-Nup96 [Patella vulgata]|uniref:nuclear pore complex protein Nup98-Nup96 n=1 Tax=Patella vulgata TaxID=6465 RepID=UPI0024A82141|nr:nuclear pore complex protein Nup98-Nup96 [Patella vulgata]